MARPLKIVYLTHYYPPESNAPAVRVSEMSERWQENRAHVTILTGFPNHPNGIIPEKYRGFKRMCTRSGKLDVIRTYIYAAANKGFLKRILNYLSFMFSAILLGTGKIGKPDILIATSPQFFVAVAGYIISRIKKCKFVFEVRDIWPEEIVAVGAIKNKLIINILENLEMFLYRKADLIVAVAQGTIDILSDRGIPLSKMALMPNGVNLDHFQAGSSDTFRTKVRLENKFIVGYVGTHGMAHNLSTVLETAAKLEEYDDIHFLFVGDGAEKRKLMMQSHQMKLDNVTFCSQVDRKEVVDVYAACDICLVPLKQASLFKKNIPSKIYEIMACRKPIIIATEGESRNLVKKAGAGLSCTPENAEELAEKILVLYNNDDYRHSMAHNGYSYVVANSSRKRIADEYLMLLNDVVQRVFPAARPETVPDQVIVRSKSIKSPKPQDKVGG